MLHSLSSSFSQEAVDPSVLLQSHHKNQVEGIHVLAENLRKALQGEEPTKKALAHWQTTIEEACKVWEADLSSEARAKYQANMKDQWKAREA